MTLVFTSENTVIIRAHFTNNNIIVDDHNIKKEPNFIFNTEVENWLKVINRRDETAAHISFISLGLDYVLAIYQKIEQTIYLILIKNDIFSFSHTRDTLSRLLIYVRFGNIREISIQNILSELQAIEKDYNTKPITKFNSYAPLLINDAFIYFEEIKADLSTSVINGDNDFISILNVLINSDNIVTLIDKYFPYLDNLEKQRMIFNLVILSQRLTNDNLFYRLTSYLIFLSDNEISDYTRILLIFHISPYNIDLSYNLICDINDSSLLNLEVESKVNFFVLRGEIFQRRGFLKESLINFYTATSLVSKLSDITHQIALAYAGIGNIYSSIHKYNNALSSFSLAKSLLEYIGLDYPKKAILNNIYTIKKIEAKNYFISGIMSLNLEHITEANVFFDNALSIIASLHINITPEQAKNNAEEFLSILHAFVERTKIDHLFLNYDLSFVDDTIKLYNLLKDIHSGNYNEETINNLKALSIPKQIKITQISIVTKSGVLIYTHNKKDINKNLLFAGAMTAIQLIIDETLTNDLSSKQILAIEAGDNKIIVKKGQYINIIAVANRSDETLLQVIDRIINIIEEKYKNILINWGGNIGDMPEIKEIISRELNSLKEIKK